jgi:DNA-binding IclR family transcriptional regulator
MTMSDEILAALRREPGGLTSRQLSDKIGKPMASVSASASRMHMRGKLDRDSIREVRTVEHEAILWRAPNKER